MKQVNIFTDGSCLGNLGPGPGPGGWAVILQYNGVERELVGGEKLTTNNRMELTAAIQGLKSLKEPCAVTLTSDSTYLVKGMTEWMAGWIRDRKIRAGSSHKNVDLWIELVNLAKIHTVTWTWVRAHAGHEMNERCDVLAKAQATHYKDNVL